jgi:hypothetical protein
MLTYQVDIFLGLEPLESVVELSLAGPGGWGHDNRGRDGWNAPAELVVGLYLKNIYIFISIFSIRFTIGSIPYFYQNK